MRIRFLVLLTALVWLAGCSGSDDDQNGADLQSRLDQAKKNIDTAETVKISLSAPELPQGVTGLLKATGEGNHSPAFQGKITVVTGGTSLTADVIATDGRVWANTGFPSIFLSVTPESLKAPDPAVLLSPEHGITQLLVRTDDLKSAGKSRDGKTVLSTITGTISGGTVQSIIPTALANGEFAATYRLTDDNTLHDVKLTGPFYAKGGDVTYTTVLTTSSDPITIEAPDNR